MGHLNARTFVHDRPNTDCGDLDAGRRFAGDTKFDFEGDIPFSDDMSPIDIGQFSEAMEKLQREFAGDVAIAAAAIGDLSSRLGAEGMTEPETMDTVEEWCRNALAGWFMPPGPGQQQRSWARLRRAVRRQHRGSPRGSWRTP